MDVIGQIANKKHAIFRRRSRNRINNYVIKFIKVLVIADDVAVCSIAEIGKQDRVH